MPLMTEESSDREFIGLLTQHQMAVLAYIRSLMPGYPGAQDVLQQTNLKLWERKSGFEVGTNFKAWAFAVARYEVLNQRKKISKDGWMVLGEHVAELIAEDLGEETGSHDEMMQALECCLEKLPAHDRELVQMRYASDQGLDEYARMLKRSAGTLKTRLFRIRAALRRCIEDGIGGEGVSA